MSDTITFQIEDLARILLEGSGAPEGGALDENALDMEFSELGYDSLALLETASRIEREYGVSVDEADLADATTPGALLALVGRRLGERGDS